MPPSTLQASTSVLSTGSTTSKADLTAEREIEAIWSEVHNKVIELAGGDPKKVQTTLDIDAVLRYIDNVSEKDKKQAEKYGTFKNAVTKTLQCISTVGGIVTDGVSNVFAPAGMCYNALTFVIQAWQGYEGIFENLAELLEKCVEFLERLESYKDRMDARLSRVACQNLRLFVQICDRTIKLRKKHSRFLAFTKQLFLSDDGIQDLLGMMEKLNAKESLLVNAQTYKIVSDSAGDIKLILDAQKEQKKEDDAKKWRRGIAKALGFPGTALDTDGEPIPVWQRAFESRLNALVEDTGLWWREDEVCSRWTKAKDPEKTIIVVRGESGTGKTSMMANTVKSIRRLGQEGPTSRVVAAYYFAEGDKRKGDEEGASEVIETVTRTLLWQIATAYEAMTKSVAHIVEKTPSFEGAIDLWHQLFVNNKERRNPDTTFYLFIDGLDAPLVPLLQRLCSIAENQKTRIFLTARPEMVTDFLVHEQGIQFNTVPISERNGNDIEKYILDRMSRMPILSNASRPGIAEWREKILHDLRDKSGGDYFKLSTSLNALSKVDLVEDINEVLAQADKSRIDQIQSEIKRLNTSRTPKEIEEINEIILWVDSGRRWFDVATIEALLSVKHRGGSVMAKAAYTQSLSRRSTSTILSDAINDAQPPATLTVSLLPFAQKLIDKYAIFTITDTGVVDWRSSEIRGQIPRKEPDPSDVLSIASSQGKRVIQDTEIDIVRHFMRNVCPTELYERFGFEQFFKTKAGVKEGGSITYDPDNAHINIALTSLVILTDESLRTSRKIRNYAMYYLLEHMEVVDLSAANPELKSQVGPLLVKLFTEECGIESMFWSFDLNVSMKTWNRQEYLHLRRTRSEWVYTTIGVTEMLRWFHDSHVTKLINTEPGLSLVKALRTPNTNLHGALLSYAAKHLATHLFLRKEFLKRHFLSACCFIRGYLSRLDPARASKMPDDPALYRVDQATDGEPWERQDFRLEELLEIETWASQLLDEVDGTPAQKSLWETVGALVTFQLCHEDNVTEIYQRRARKAIELNPQNLHACHFIAKQANTSNDEAVGLLSRARQIVDDMRSGDDEWLGNHFNSSLLARITIDLGDRLWDLGKDLELAARTHRESLQYDYVHFLSYAEVLRRYQKSQQWGEFIAFVEALNAASEVWTAYFDELVNEFISDLVVKDSDMLAQAADATGKWDVIESFFTIAIDIGKKQEAHDLLFLLRDCFAKNLAKAEDIVHQDMVVAVRVDALTGIRAHPSDTLSRHMVDTMADSLAETYLDRAFRPNLPSEKIESYGSSIAALLPDTSDVLDVWMTTITVCCLIRYHHKLGSDSKLARDWIQRIVWTSIELLSDSDEENDDSAYWLLARLLTTLQDDENARITWAMRNLIQYEAQQRWEDWIMTPVNSPINAKPLAEQLGQRTTTFSDATPSLVQKVWQRPLPRTDSSSSVQSQSSDINGNKLDGSRVPTPTLDTGATRPQPASASASDADVDAATDSSPSKPSWFVSCDGCDKQWTVMDVPLYSCADCVGHVQLDKECHTLLLQDKLGRKKGFACRRDHAFVEIPRWEPGRFAGLPKGAVPLPDGVNGEGGERWISLEEWKGRLRRKYLDS
ncbi:Uu.00g129090.m01.CDS01 [Anthostomella pinea]|uniref:Uu.00g129090.m01.CDS01 n=1 Tax=Anthostomella pinea TaxID=933095 RepID=A0AAI8VJD6_9PEZI|nr:Uu.00g129090.m01.CDS01 [Anthostomella pinea]